MYINKYIISYSLDLKVFLSIILSNHEVIQSVSFKYLHKYYISVWKSVSSKKI